MPLSQLIPIALELASLYGAGKAINAIEKIIKPTNLMNALNSL